MDGWGAKIDNFKGPVGKVVYIVVMLMMNLMGSLDGHWSHFQGTGNKSDIRLSR